MIKIEDWLQDPLRKIENGSYKRCELKSPTDDKQNDLWFIFHYATRLKLDGADFFCRQVLGAASMSSDLGLPSLAYEQQKWYLDAFFFELMSACDTLLQELNIVYAYNLGLKPEQVRWNNTKLNNFMKKLPINILENITAERGKDWFYKVKRYRDTSTHHYLVPLGSHTIGWGHIPSSRSTHKVSMYYQDKEGNIKNEDINTCRVYLDNVVQLIKNVWKFMAEEFE